MSFTANTPSPPWGTKEGRKSRGGSCRISLFLPTLRCVLNQRTQMLHTLCASNRVRWPWAWKPHKICVSWHYTLWSECVVPACIFKALLHQWTYIACRFQTMDHVFVQASTNLCQIQYIAGDEDTLRDSRFSVWNSCIVDSTRQLLRFAPRWRGTRKQLPALSSFARRAASLPSTSLHCRLILVILAIARVWIVKGAAIFVHRIVWTLGMACRVWIVEAAAIFFLRIVLGSDNPVVRRVFSTSKISNGILYKFAEHPRILTLQIRPSQKGSGRAPYYRLAMALFSPGGYTFTSIHMHLYNCLCMNLIAHMWIVAYKNQCTPLQTRRACKSRFILVYVHVWAIHVKNFTDVYMYISAKIHNTHKCERVDNI